MVQQPIEVHVLSIERPRRRWGLSSPDAKIRIMDIVCNRGTILDVVAILEGVISGMRRPGQTVGGHG